MATKSQCRRLTVPRVKNKSPLLRAQISSRVLKHSIAKGGKRKVAKIKESVGDKVAIHKEVVEKVVVKGVEIKKFALEFAPAASVEHPGQQLIKTQQQATGKRSSTPTRK